MKFQDSSFDGLKVTVGTKSVTHPRTHAPKAICPINFFKVGGIKKRLYEGCVNILEHTPIFVSLRPLDLTTFIKS